MKNNRFSSKLNNLLWWILKILPLVFFISLLFTNRSSDDTFLLNLNNYLYDLPSCFESVMYTFVSSYDISIIFSFINYTFVEFFDFGFSSGLCMYLSYVIYLDILRLFIDVILFIFNYCRNLLNDFI